MIKDVHCCSYRDLRIEGDNITVGKTDAAVRRGRTNTRFLVCAVEVYVAQVGVLEASLLAFEPENTSENLVALEVFFRIPDSFWFAAFKDRAFGSVSPVFLANTEGSKGSFVGTFFATQSEFGGRNGKTHQKFLSGVKSDLLSWDGYFEVFWSMSEIGFHESDARAGCRASFSCTVGGC